MTVYIEVDGVPVLSRADISEAQLLEQIANNLAAAGLPVSTCSKDLLATLANPIQPVEGV
jgi:hypothetical protein